MICHQASAFFGLQARAERNLGLLSTERDHIAEDRATLITPDESDEEKIRRQSVAFGHETTNAVELAAVVSHQHGVVRAGQKFARLKLLAPAELFRHELSFVCHQRLSTFFRSRVCLCLRSQSVDLSFDGGELGGILQLVLLPGRQCLP
jgi:hypothetical protein